MSKHYSDGHTSRQQILFFATSYVTPLALICGLYLCMLLRLWRGVAPGGHVSAESRRGKKRVTRMVVVVVAIFAICWFPIQVGYSSSFVSEDTATYVSTSVLNFNRML
jgi:hypothetical protein